MPDAGLPSGRGDGRPTLLLASVVAVVLLLLTYHSPVLGLLPLVSIGVTTQVANVVIYPGLPISQYSG